MRNQKEKQNKFYTNQHKRACKQIAKLSYEQLSCISSTIHIHILHLFVLLIATKQNWNSYVHFQNWTFYRLNKTQWQEKLSEIKKFVKNSQSAKTHTQTTQVTTASGLERNHTEHPKLIWQRTVKDYSCVNFRPRKKANKNIVAEKEKNKCWTI